MMSILMAQPALLSPLLHFLYRSKQNKAWAEPFTSQITSYRSRLFGPSIRWKWSNLIRLKLLLTKVERGLGDTTVNSIAFIPARF